MIQFGMYNILIGFIPIITSFFITYYFTKRWIELAKIFGFMSKDMNKYEKPLVAEPGGPFVIFGTTIGILTYLFLKSYIIKTETNILEILSILIVTILAGFLGLFDDVLGWKKGLKPWQKPLFTLPFALPLMVLKMGETKMTIPFLGTIDFGILYPLLLVPIGIMGASNAFNMIAGYNGLEATMGILLFLGIAIKSYLLEKYYLVIISLIIISSLLAFLYFNKYPAKIFPGNSFTYAIGALFGSLVIVGNMEKFGIILFSLYFLELILFLRGLKDGIYKENFAIPDPQNNLREPYEKIYSTTHLAVRVVRKIKGYCKETDVVLFLAILQIIILIIALLV